MDEPNTSDSPPLWGESDPAHRVALRTLPGYRSVAGLAKSVATVSNARGAFDLARYWMLVAAAYGCVIFWNFHWLAMLLAFAAVAKAQNSLLLVGHEAIHYLLFRNRRVNDWAGEFLTYAPMGIGFRRARLSHLEHHRAPLSEADEKIEQQLLVPTRPAYVRHLGAPLLGSYVVTAVSRILGLKLNRRARPKFVQKSSSARLDLAGIVLAQIVLFVGLAVIDWRLYAFFWMLPLVTLTAFFHKAKGFIDHAMLPGESVNLAYSYRVSALDQMFFGTLQAYHAEHHLFPGVPYYRLGRIFATEPDLPFMRRRRSYFGFLVAYYRALSAVRK